MGEGEIQGRIKGQKVDARGGGGRATGGTPSGERKGGRGQEWKALGLGGGWGCEEKTTSIQDTKV